MATKVKKLITGHRINHPISDIECLDFKLENLGRWLIQQKIAIGLMKYLDNGTQLETHTRSRRKAFK